MSSGAFSNQGRSWCRSLVAPARCYSFPGCRTVFAWLSCWCSAVAMRSPRRRPVCQWIRQSTRRRKIARTAVAERASSASRTRAIPGRLAAASCPVAPIDPAPPVVTATRAPRTVRVIPNAPRTRRSTRSGSPAPMGSALPASSACRGKDRPDGTKRASLSGVMRRAPVLADADARLWMTVRPASDAGSAESGSNSAGARWMSVA
jgi:hypothetical protein